MTLTVWTRKGKEQREELAARLRIKKNEERSSENLTIRIKPSIKEKLRKLSEQNEIGMAQCIESLIENEFERMEFINFNQDL